MTEKIKERIVSPRWSLIDAMKRMDELGVKILFVYDGDDFIGLLTIGDIQRAIIRNVALTEHLAAVLDKNKIYAYTDEDETAIKEKMRRLRAECMPIIDHEGQLVDVWFWKDVFINEQTPQKNPIDVPVVIMAGGKGTRLQPLTNVIPKPLVPIGEKTILEEILDQFEGIGCKRFYMSVNYKSDMIRYYLSQLEHHYQIEFFQEPKPLGTIGSVALLKEVIHTPFFVSNCDILIDQDYRSVYEYHVANRNELTVVTAVKSHKIPYGVVETGENGLMTALREKPETTYMINTGVYVLNPDLICDIPEGEFFHITDLMEVIRKRGGRIGCFPVSENAWRDVGEWTEYLKIIKVL